MLTNRVPKMRLLLLKSTGQFKHSGKYYLSQGRWHALHHDKPAPKGAPVASVPHAAGQHLPATLTTDQVEALKYPAEKAEANHEMKNWNEKHIPELLGHAANGDATAILGGSYGSNTHGKLKAKLANMLLEKMGSKHVVKPGQKAGTHAAVQTAPVEPPASEPPASPEPDNNPEDAAPQQPASQSLAMPAFSGGTVGQSVIDYYEGVAQKVLSLAAAGDAAALEQMKQDGLKPNKKGKISNTWAAKTPNSKMLLALHTQALEQAKGGAAAPAESAKDQAIQAAVDHLKEDAKQPGMPAGEAAEDKALVQKLEAAQGDQNPIKNEDAAPATVSEQPAAAEQAPIKKEPRLVIPKAPREANPAPTEAKPATEGKAALADFNWDGLKPPSGSKNYSTYSKKIDALKNAVLSGDVAAIEAMSWGKNTYNQKLSKLAATALAALKEGGAPAVAEPVPSATPSPSAKPDAGPHEGDLKQGADGMLVLKEGHWVKVGEEQPVEQAPAAQPAQEGVQSVQIPDFGTISPGKWGTAYQKVAEALHEAATLHGAEGLKGKVINHADGTFTIKAAGYNLKKVGPDNHTNDLLAKARRAAMHAYVTQLKAAVGKPKKAAKPKAAAAPQPAPAATAPAIESMDSWQQTGPQGGSNPGGRFKDADGVEWYCKFPADEDVAKSELLAAKLYAALGISGQDAKLVTKGGKVGIASKWTSVSKASSPAALAKTDGVASGFGADAWLGNWDVVGLGFDNLQIGADGKAHRVDAGGSLMYRAQGGKKAFGNVVSEIDSLRDAKINPQAAAVFGGLTNADITASVAKVVSLPDASIRAICFQHGPGDEAASKALADTLIARKNDLAAKFPKAAKAKKKRLDPNNLPIDPSQLPKRHDFDNWNGPGKGLSSQPHVNAANHAVEQEALDLAKTGNLTKLKDFHFHEIDKATGNATGKMLPIKNHPSKHVVQFHADLVQLLDEVANPPEPLKHFVESDVGTLDALAAVFPPKPFGTTVDSVKSNEKLGFWVVLGGAAAVEKFKPQKVMDYTAAAIQAAYAKYQQAKPLAKHFINSVQASGSYNDLFRNGKEFDGHGNKLTDVAKAAFEQATSMPEGTSLYRWQNMSDDMVKKIMGAPDGTVFQATGPMCTSYSSTATSGFGQHRVTIRYAAGAKAVESFGSGAFKGEKEVTTLPNSRFVILSKKMVQNEKNPSKQRLELEVLMLAPDLGIAA